MLMTSSAHGAGPIQAHVVDPSVDRVEDQADSARQAARGPRPPAAEGFKAPRLYGLGVPTIQARRA